MGSRRAALVVAVLGSILACTSRAPELDLGPSPMGVSVQATVAYYDIPAATLGELRRAMVTIGPTAGGRRWAATTSSRLSWRYHTRVRNVGCEVSDVTVRVSTNITFPRWTPQGEPDSTLTAWWDAFRAGLAEHERGHAQLSVKAASDIRSAIDGMSGGTCTALGIRINDTARRISLAMQERQAEYDAATRHGGTQIEKARRLREP
jgi:predicted secreted Zn-dependent protease